jgi:hypothetical protein
MSVLTKTCGNACRLRRSRRIRRAAREVEEFEQNHGLAAAEVAAVVRRESPDVITRVMHTALEPIVRESITEDVLQAINGMVGLTVQAVNALQEDLSSEDSTVRQRAYSLVIKYTVGHPALVKPTDTDEGKQLVVNFNLPRPDSEPIEADAEEVIDVECDMCHMTKPSTEFVAGSTRCAPCFESWRSAIKEQFA